MVFRIPQDVLDRVLAAHDVVEVVGRSVSLKKLGRAWKALCPFHDEKTPSFTVNPERQSWKCFGCGKGGNVFGFLMEREHLKFFEAVRQLAAEKGIPVPTVGRSDAAGTAGEGVATASRAAAIRDAIAFAQDLFVRTLWGPTGATTRAYLEKRGFPPPASKQFGLGLSPDGWDGLITAARARGIGPDVLEDAGLAIRSEKRSGNESHYDRFRSRLMFPVADVSGRIVTYGARALRDGDEPKYLNGPETTVFRKSKTLYGLDRSKDGIKRFGHAILMEGYTDVLMAHMHGFSCSVAGMGTSFTPEQARSLASFTGKVVLLYDGDAAGRMAAEKSLDLLLEHGLEVRVALLPEGRDVDEVLLEEGVEALDAIVKSAPDFFDFKVARLGASLDLSTERGRAMAAERMAESLVRVKSAIERDLLFPRVAERLGVREVLVREAAGRLLAGRQSRAGREGRGQERPRGGEGAAGAGGTGSSVGHGTSDGSSSSDGAEPLSAQDQMRLTDQRLAHERFVAAVLLRPEFLPEIRKALPAAEIGDEGLRLVYEAALSLHGQGLVPSIEAVARLLAAEPMAGTALAGLPDDVRFEDWVPDALRQRRIAASLVERRKAVLQGLAGFRTSPQDVPPVGGPVRSGSLE